MKASKDHAMCILRISEDESKTCWSKYIEMIQVEEGFKFLVHSVNKFTCKKEAIYETFDVYTKAETDALLNRFYKKIMPDKEHLLIMVFYKAGTVFRSVAEDGTYKHPGWKPPKKKKIVKAKREEPKELDGQISLF